MILTNPVTTRPNIIKIAPVNPSHEAIEKAASVIKAGGTIAYPTRCLYGLGADAFNGAAVEGLFSIKRRSAQKAILILIDHPKQLKRLVSHVPGIAGNIMRQFWPGQVTLVFEAGPDVPPGLTGGSGKIGIRLPGHPVASALVEAVAGPITGTSANLSGRSMIRSATKLRKTFGRAIDYYLPGELGGNLKPSEIRSAVSGEVLRAQ